MSNTRDTILLAAFHQKQTNRGSGAMPRLPHPTGIQARCCHLSHAPHSLAATCHLGRLGLGACGRDAWSFVRDCSHHNEPLMWTCCAVHIAPRGRHETSVTPLLRDAPRAPPPKEFISESLEVVGGRKLRPMNAFQHHTLISQIASALPSPEPTRTSQARCSTDVTCRFELSLSLYLDKATNHTHVGGLAPHLDAVREELGDAVLDLACPNDAG